MPTKILYLLCLLTADTICNAQTSTYKINKIETVRKYYIIYAANADSNFKIVSKKEHGKKCNLIEVNKSYDLTLSKIHSIAAGEIDCFSFDKAVICKEDTDGLAIATNLKGLCIIK